MRDNTGQNDLAQVLAVVTACCPVLSAGRASEKAHNPKVGGIDSSCPEKSMTLKLKAFSDLAAER